MATEKSFADRLGRGIEMQAAIGSFAPAFAPADQALLPATFMSFLDQLSVLNTETADLVDQYTTGVNDRTALVKDLSKRGTRVLAHIRSNSAWAKYERTVKTVVDKIRGTRPKKPQPPAAGEAAAETKQRNQGERSFAEMEGHLNRLVKAVEKITGYDPPADEIKLPQLQALATQLHDLNISMHDLGIDVGNKQKERFAAFNAAGGLKEQMKAIKNAVKSQYGTASPEYAAVKSIRL